MNDDMVHTTSDATPSEAMTSIDLDHSLETVWQAITSERGLASWMGEGSSIGPEPGDDVVVNDVVGGEIKHGVVQEVEPGERLRYRWWSVGDPGGATTVSIELEPCISVTGAAGTRVTVVESRSATEPVLSAQASSAWAWRSALLLLAVESLVALPVLCR